MLHLSLPEIRALLILVDSGVSDEMLSSERRILNSATDKLRSETVMLGGIASPAETRVQNNKTSIRDALRPFAEIGSMYLKADESDDSIYVKEPDDREIRPAFTVGMFRAAARALGDV